MVTQYDAYCDNIGDKGNGSRHLLFSVVQHPSEYPGQFNNLYTSEEVERLIEYSDTSDYELGGIGWVPVIYNETSNGWEIDWQGLESYSLE